MRIKTTIEINGVQKEFEFEGSRLEIQHIEEDMENLRKGFKKLVEIEAEG